MARGTETDERSGRVGLPIAGHARGRVPGAVPPHPAVRHAATAGSGTAAAPAPSGRWRRAGVLALAAAAVLTTVGVQLLIRAVDLPAESNVPTAAVTWTTVAGGLALVAAVLAARAPMWMRSLLVVVALTATGTAVLAWPLHGTDWYFGGLTSDQQFRTQYLTRLADDAALADMNYAGLPPFYPAGWFWPAGRVTDLLGLPAWSAYKPISLATVGLTPALAFAAWSRLVSWRSAVGVGAVTLIAAVSLAATEPYSWPVAALLPAAAVSFSRQLSRAGGPSTPGLVAGGVFLGVAGSTYTLYGFFGAVLFTALAAGHLLGRGRAERRAALLRAVTALATVAGVAVVVALPAWGPFLAAVVRSGTGDNTAARFLPEESARLPELLGADPWALLLTVGLLALLARACGRAGAHRDVLSALLATAACAVAWYGASSLALLAGTTLLAFRMDSIAVLAVATAGVLALADLGPRAATVLAGRGLVHGRLPVAAGVLAVLAAVQVVADRGADLEPRVASAYSTPYPGGPDARGTVDPAREEGWSDALAREIARQTTGEARDLVVLSTNYSLLSFQPYRGFQQITPHYANPLADHRARTDYLERLARSSSTDELLAGLDAAPWAPPTVFVLGNQADGLHLRLCRDAFPATPNVAFFDVVLAAELFDDPAFTTAEVGPYLVAVRRPAG